MSAVIAKAAKAERIEVRVTPQVKSLLTAAAQLRHTSVSDFLLTQAVAAAEQVVAAPRLFYASEAGWAAIQQLLDAEDQAPDPATISWLTRQRRAAGP